MIVKDGQRSNQVSERSRVVRSVPGAIATGSVRMPPACLPRRWSFPEQHAGGVRTDGYFGGGV
ncbi:MAG TPA: hypothetical protein VN476_09905 [Pyrinomonadaceae bacterium]|nr:hypothetical protein [Pyrinomonadaceae bacterium]